MIKRLIVSLLWAAMPILWTAPVQAEAQKAPGSSAWPSVDQILAKHVKATGGEAAARKITNRVMKGSLSSPMAATPVQWEMRTKAPNKRLTIMDIPSFGLLREGYNGKAGWSQNPQSGITEKSGEDLDRLQREAEFYRDLKFKEIFPRMKVLGKAKAGDRDAYQVEATPAKGKPDLLYFDVENGLLVRQDLDVPGMGGRMTLEVYLEDFKEVDGVKVPCTVRVPAPEMVKFTLKIDEVKHNVKMEDSEFDKPSN